MQAKQNRRKQLQKTIASPFNFARNPNHKTRFSRMAVEKRGKGRVTFCPALLQRQGQRGRSLAPAPSRRISPQRGCCLSPPGAPVTTSASDGNRCGEMREGWREGAVSKIEVSGARGYSTRLCSGLAFGLKNCRLVKFGWLELCDSCEGWGWGSGLQREMHSIWIRGPQISPTFWIFVSRGKPTATIHSHFSCCVSLP